MSERPKSVDYDGGYEGTVSYVFDLEIYCNELQSAHDKLKARFEGAPTVKVRRDETVIDNGLALTVTGDSRLHILDNGKKPWTQMWVNCAIVELTPEEMDKGNQSP